MFTVGDSYARLSCRQGTDLWMDMVCRLVPFVMAWKHSYGFLQSTYSLINKYRIVLKVFAFRNIIVLQCVEYYGG